MGNIRTKELLTIKHYLHGRNQRRLAIKSDANIFETPVVILQDADENKIVIKRAGINDSYKSQVFTLTCNVWQMSFTTEMQSGVYELEPEESDYDTMTYYLTE